jgi:acetoacetyl-CoA synthetase
MVEILGRSDSTLNPGGIRIGTAEFYQILDSFSNIEDCLVSSAVIDNEEKIVLFVKLVSGASLTSELKKQIRIDLKTKASPRHMPQMICQVNEIPYTTNGKKCEVIVKKILRGDSILKEDTALQNNDALNDYLSFVKTLEISN